MISGFTTDSDVDLVAVWQTLPDRAVIQGATRVVLDDLVLEKARCVNHDLDVMHLPLSGFSSWVDAVETGRTWRSSAWPDPLYAVAGLAHGLVVHDPSGEAARLQSRLSRPAPMFVKAVRDGVRQALPDYLRELRAATTRGDLWLHQKLLGELIRMEYVLLFAVAGHYCPFPKHLSAWLDRLGIEPSLVALDRDVWGAPTPEAQTQAAEDLAIALLDTRDGVRGEVQWRKRRESPDCPPPLTGRPGGAPSAGR